jgi:Zn-dependent protease with chaperone function
MATFQECVSPQENKAKISFYILNGLVMTVLGLFLIGWIIASFGLGLLIIGGIVLLRYLFSGVTARMIRAQGVVVSANQLPHIQKEINAVRALFHFHKDVPVVILPHSALNALALKLAGKRMIILFSQVVEAVESDPAQLRALLAHEFCHQALDFSGIEQFAIIKPAPFKSGRELTCDRAALLAANSLESTRTLLRKLAAGKELSAQLNDQALSDEATELYSGLTGWFLKNYLTHPPVGTRLNNVCDFAAEQRIA